MWYPHRTPALVQKLYPTLIWHKSRQEKVIYLTFDDGPIPEVTPWVLEVLSQYGIKGTFFCVGDNIQKYPHVLSQIVEQGHRVGNHTFHHVSGWKTASQYYLDNIKKCDTMLATYLTNSERRIFRPPYGRFNNKQIAALSGDYDIVMWDVLSGDFDKKKSADVCLEKTIKATRNGSIVVFHDSLRAAKNLKQILPKYINHYLQEGYEFSTI